MALISKLFKGDPKLAACQTSDPAHITKGTVGPHVTKIQKAVSSLGDVKIDPIEVDQQRYGDSTTRAVLEFKRAHNILNFENKLDDIVGKKTITKLDEQMDKFERRSTPLSPAHTPTVGAAGVQVGPVGNRVGIILEYYAKCGLETIGPGQVTTAGMKRYSTLEDLIDLLQQRGEAQQVIVNHGDPERGLLMPCCKETSFRETGKIMFLLSGLADMAEKGPINPKDPSTKVLLEGAASDMKVSEAVVLRIVGKLVSVRRKKLILHFRACNMDDPVMIGAYKSAFGAIAVTFHAVRLLFMPFILDQMKPGKHVAQFSSARNSAKARLRTFDDPLGLLWPMMLAIVDIDGHSHVSQESFIEHRSPEQLRGWAEFLVRRWRDAAPHRFVVPIMWDDNERTFHCPLEVGWRQKLQIA